jgi:hypothetical protein
MDGKRKWESSSTDDDEQVAKQLQMYYDDEKLAQCLQDQGGYSVAADLKNKAMAKIKEILMEKARSVAHDRLGLPYWLAICQNWEAW